MNESNSEFERYALYWCPLPKTALARFAADWFGEDAAARFDLAPQVLAEATARPRRYGFHATLVAPFRLHAQSDRTGLENRVAQLAAMLPPIALGPLELQRIDDFLALVPAVEPPQLRALHTHCLFALESFAANAAEQRRRRSNEAKDRTAKLLAAQWGYAHVLQRYRFHLTLSGPLEGTGSEILRRALERIDDHYNGEPAQLDALSLMGDPGPDQSFRELARFPLCQVGSIA